jgi:hypothetical protein
MKFKDLVNHDNQKGNRKFKIIVTEQQFRRIIDSLVTESENKTLNKLSSLKSIQHGK